MNITIGTRASKLAMQQTQWIVQRLHRLWPNLEITIEQIHTTGDRVTNVPLSQIGSDGVFVTEIESALRERRIDLAVHSLKDLPTAPPEGLSIIVPGPREDVRDLFIWRADLPIANSTPGIADLLAKGGSVRRVGTCSLRRTAQIQVFFPDVEILPLRGNVDTRLRKLDAGAYDGIVLASAGVHRLGLHHQLVGRCAYFPLDVMLPAPGQGALALECRAEPEILALVEPLRDQAVQVATAAERMFMRRLGAGCYLPVAAHAVFSNGVLRVQGLVTSLTGERSIRVELSLNWTSASTLADAELLGERLAELAMEQGAEKIIDALLRQRQEHPHA